MRTVAKILLVAIGITIIRYSNVDIYLLNILGGVFGVLCIMFSFDL